MYASIKIRCLSLTVMYLLLVVVESAPVWPNLSKFTAKLPQLPFTKKSPPSEEAPQQQEGRKEMEETRPGTPPRQGHQKTMSEQEFQALASTKRYKLFCAQCRNIVDVDHACPG